MVTSKRSAVNVVIAARHEEKHISACLEALLRQSVQLDASDIIVVVNATNDRTLDLARHYNVTTTVSLAPTVAAVRNTGIRLGDARYIAFLDAHCIASPDWLENLLAHFEQSDIGGCAGALEYVCADPLTQRLCAESIYANSERIFHHTSFGRTSPFPWLASGNALFLREAVEEVGLFDESLVACEDVDLSWKVFLRGYRLTTAANAWVRHYDESRPLDFVRKFVRYGRGAAQLARRYEMPCLPRLSLPKGSGGYWRLLLQSAHGLGALCETFAGQAAPLTPTSVRTDVGSLRTAFLWDSDWFRLANDCFYWTAEKERIVLLKRNSDVRIELENTSNYIFRQITSGRGRSTVLDAYASHYQVPREQAVEDLDYVFQQFLDEGVLEQVAHSAP